MLEPRWAANIFQVVVSAEILLKHATVDLGDMLLQIGPHDAALENGDYDNDVVWQEFSEKFEHFILLYTQIYNVSTRFGRCPGNWNQELMNACMHACNRMKSSKHKNK